LELELIVLSIELHIPDLPIVGSRREGGTPGLSFDVSFSPLPPCTLISFFLSAAPQILLSEDGEIEHRTVATLSLAVRRSRSHPYSARTHPLSARYHPQLG
jgi:hypothetical protein